MSFQQGLSGLNAAARNLEVIGNNVANASTIGFKGSRAQFSDVYASTLGIPANSPVGIGTMVSSVAQQFTQGNLSTTSNPLDLAINGEGFFRVSNGGTIGYTRNGQFQLDKDGYIVTSNGARLSGYAADPLGNISPGTPGDLRISRDDLAPQLTTEANVSINLDSRKAAITTAFSMTDPTTYHGATSMSVYDSQGGEHALALYFTKTADNTWRVNAAVDGTAIAGAVGSLTFDTDGTLDTAASALPFALSIPVATGATTPLAIDLGFDGATQFGAATTVNELTQDGYTSGKITGFSVGPDGVILGRYSNGKTLAQGQVALASFINPQGLTPLGGNLWAETSTSGQPLVGTPESGTLGAIAGGALEESNVDLTQELVNMITAQRVYQANAQTIKTQDSVMQTLVNLR